VPENRAMVLRRLLPLLRLLLCSLCRLGGAGGTTWFACVLACFSCVDWGLVSRGFCLSVSLDG
jgi:hypothetical protein